jgi:cation transport ATPase
MGSGTEIAHASARVLLIGNDLRKFAATLKTARWCRAVILQKVGTAFSRIYRLRREIFRLLVVLAPLSGRDNA